MTSGSFEADRWSAFIREPDRSGLFVDFDGTLAPIVSRAADAVPFPGAMEILDRLAQIWAVVAVVSGRPAAFLASQLSIGAAGPPGSVRAFGLYGLEWFDADGSYRVDPDASRWAETVQAATGRALQAAPEGLEVERKGLTVTLHWRARPEVADWARRHVEAEASKSGLAFNEGRMSIELRPPVGGDKGTVVERLGRGLKAAAYVGDDRADLAAFDALDRLAVGGITTVRVGVRSTEAPPELLSRADVILDDPAAVKQLLTDLSR